MGYFTQTDLENALSAPVVRAIYDDDHSGEVDTSAIEACINYGSVQCDSYLRNVLMDGTTPIVLPLTSVPDEVKFAAVDFGIAYSMRRRPDVVKAMGEQPWLTFMKDAREQMKNYCASIQRMPPETGTPVTVGGVILNPDSDTDGAEEELPTEGRWVDMGDFA